MEPDPNGWTNGQHKKGSKGANDWGFVAGASETPHGVKTSRPSKFRSTPAPAMRDAHSGDETFTDSTSDTDGITAKPRHRPPPRPERHARVISGPRDGPPKKERDKGGPDNSVPPKVELPEKRRERREPYRRASPSLTSEDDLWEEHNGRLGGRFAQPYRSYPNYGGGNLVPYTGYGYGNPYNPFQPPTNEPRQSSGYAPYAAPHTGFNYPTAGSHYPQPPVSYPPPPNAPYNMGPYIGGYGYAPPQPWASSSIPYQAAPAPAPAPTPAPAPAPGPLPYPGAPPAAPAELPFRAPPPAPAPAPGGQQPSTRRPRRAPRQPTYDSESEQEERLLRDDELRSTAMRMMQREFRTARLDATMLVEDLARKEKELEVEKREHHALLMAQMERDLREKLMAEERARLEARERDAKREAEMLARVREQVARENEERHRRGEEEAARIEVLREEIRGQVGVQLQAEMQGEFEDIRREAEAARDRAKDVMDRVEAEAADKEKAAEVIDVSKPPSLITISDDERSPPRRRRNGRRTSRMRVPSPPRSIATSSTSDTPSRRTRRTRRRYDDISSEKDSSSSSSSDSGVQARRTYRHSRRRREASTTTGSAPTESSGIEDDIESKLEGLADRVARKISQRLGGQMPPPPGFVPPRFGRAGAPPPPPPGWPIPPPPGFEQYAEPGSWHKYSRENAWRRANGGEEVGGEASAAGPEPVPVPMDPAQSAVDDEWTEELEPDDSGMRRQSLHQEDLTMAVILRPVPATGVGNEEATRNDVGVQELAGESQPVSGLETTVGQGEASLEQPDVEGEITRPDDTTRGGEDFVDPDVTKPGTQIIKEVSGETDEEWHVAPEAKDIGPEVTGKSDDDGKGAMLGSHCIIQ